MPSICIDPAHRCGCAPSGCNCTAGICAFLRTYTSPFTGRACGVCTSPGCATLTAKSDGTVLFTRSLAWDGIGFNHADSPIHLTDHFLDSGGTDIGPCDDVFTFYPQGTSLDSGSAFTGDHLSILGGTDANDSAWHTSTGVDPYSCDDTGFHAHWALVTGTGGFGTSLALYQSVTDLYVDIAPWNPSCAINFQVTGCNFLPLAGATVDVWTNSAKTSHVGTATTDTSGNAFIPIGTTASSLSRYYEVKKSPRFVLFSQTLTMTPGDAVPVNMHPASGYHCDGIPACADPLPETLHATHPTFGAVTLTWNGSGSLGQGWYATVNYNYPGCFCCPAKTVTVTCFLDIALGYSDNWKSN